MSTNQVGQCMYYLYENDQNGIYAVLREKSNLQIPHGRGTKGELVRSKKVKNVIGNDLVGIAVAGS